MLRITRRLAVAAAAVAAILPFAAPASAQSTLKASLHSDLKIIDPIWTTALITQYHGYLVYDTLFALDDKLQVQPQMVDTWKMSDDKLTWTFTLRDGMTWHDGAPVTAADCVASLKRWGAKDTMGQKLMSYVTELSAPDDKTIKMVLKEPYGLVLSTLGKPGSNVPFMMPARIAATDPNTQITDATGSGPFVFKKDEWKPGEKVVYLKNTKYKPRSEPASGLAGGKLAKVDRIEWLWIPDAQTQVSALLNDEVDLIDIVPPDLLPLVQKEKGIKIMVINQAGRQYAMRFNVLHKPFDDPKVRQAVLYALNQKDFLDANVGNPEFYKECKSLFPCGSPLESTKGWEDKLGGNVAKAKQLLQEAGYDGTPIVLMHQTDTPGHNNLATVAKAAAREGGLQGRSAIDGLADLWSAAAPRRIRCRRVAGVPSSPPGPPSTCSTRWRRPSSTPLATRRPSGGPATPNWRSCATPMPRRPIRPSRRRSPSRSSCALSSIRRTHRSASSRLSTALGRKATGLLPSPAMALWNVEKK